MRFGEEACRMTQISASSANQPSAKLLGKKNPLYGMRASMIKRTVWSCISVYGTAHALVDAACAAVVFAILAAGRSDPQDLLLFVILYNVLAFATQPVFGFLADAVKTPAYPAVAGIALVAASTLLTPVPMLAVVTAGVGNAVFHVGGGRASLILVPGKATWPGIFVAPGALGLLIGTLIGKGGNFAAWPFILLLMVSAALILILPGPRPTAARPLPESLKWFEAVIVLLLLSIAVRGMVGASLVLPWKSDPALLVALTSAVVLGKAFGGILGDRFGWTRVAVSGLAVSAPLLAFLANIPAAAILGVFLFNLSMPITLVCLAEMLPGKSGFAFGLTAFALILGAAPAFTQLRSVTGLPLFVFIAVLFSIAALYGALRLYFGYYGGVVPARRHPTQPEVEEARSVL
jgi:MFS transporter, FSR family, fosmidomycin resistance protein